MTFSKLGTLLYYAYTLKGEPISQELIKLHASSIISSLGREWEAAPVYAQLKEAAAKPSPKGEAKTQAMAITEVKRRGKQSNAIKASAALGRRSSRHDSKREMDSQTHGSKSLPPPQSGRRSGKEAGLRLASSPAMKRVNRGEESSDDDGSRPRKRKRPSTPEIGDDSDISLPPRALHSLSYDHSEEDTVEEAELDLPPAETTPSITLKMVAEALPTLSPSGPNGTWACDREDCAFVVRAAARDEGQARIRAHFGEHAERLEREALARQEAAQRRLPIDHLLEKLRSLGEQARLGAFGEPIARRIVPEPIKRERGSAV